MNALQYREAAWRYWGYEAGPIKPDASTLSDADLRDVELLLASSSLPQGARDDVMREWDRRHLKVKVYTDTAPKKKRR